MKIKKSMFKSLKGYKYIKEIEEAGYCNSIDCKKCPLDRRNLNDSPDWADCSDIIDVNGYAVKNPIEIEKMNKLIDIFRKYYVNNKLKKYGINIRYQQSVKYNDKTFNVLDIVKIKDNETEYFIVLLTGTDENNIYLDKIKTVNKDDEYNLWVDIQDIEIKEQKII